MKYSACNVLLRKNFNLLSVILFLRLCQANDKYLVVKAHPLFLTLFK